MRVACGSPRTGLAVSVMLVALTQATVLAAQSAATGARRPATSTGTGDVAAETVRAQALEYFARGSAAFGDRRYKDAVDLFLEADRLVKNMAFAYNTALAYEQMGDTENALAWYREYLRRALAAPDRAQIVLRIGRLEQALARKGVQQVTVLSLPPGATVVLDDHPVGVTPWTAEIPPGPHALQLHLRGYEDSKTLFALGALHAEEVNLALTPAPPDAASNGGANLAPWGWVGLGVGVAGFGAAIGCEVARGHAENDARSAVTQVAASDAYGRMAELRTAARVLVGVGAAATVVGGVLLVVDVTTVPHEPGLEQDDASVQAAAGCHAGTCGLEMLGQF